MINIVVPMSGRGSRFAAHSEKYPVPKPWIEIKGQPMVRWALGSFPFVHSATCIFIILEEHDTRYHMKQKLIEWYGPRTQVICIPQVTRGAAETVLAAKDRINTTMPLIISDSDHYLDGNTLWKSIQEEKHVDGIIPVFEAHEPKWSFSRIGKDGYVDLVAEKNPISPYANIGAYYFARGNNFVTHASSMIQEDDRTNNEFYIAPVYNRLIKHGMKIKLSFPKYVYGLGTPEDLEYFISHTDFPSPL